MAVAAPLPLARVFWRLMAARFFSTFATQMLSILIGWQVYAHTHSALALGAVGLAEAVPALCLALWAGYQVDHGDPERIFRNVLSGTLLAVTLLLATYVWADATGGALPLLALYAVSVTTGAARAYYQPCMTVLLPQLVRRAALPRAAAWGTSSMQVARVLGPALGGLLYGFAGPRTMLHLICGLFMLSLVTFGRKGLRAQLPQADAAPAVVTATPAAEGQPLTQALLEGVHYVRQHPVLLSALTLDMVCVFFGSVTAVLPIFAEQVLGCGPQGLGILRAAPALGGVLGSLLLTRLDVRPRAGWALLCSVAGFGLCTLMFAASRHLPTSLVILVVSGMLDSVSVLVRQLIVQLMSPAHMRGRISAVNAMFIGSSNEIGEFESGVAAATMGLVPSVVFGGVVCLGVVGLMATKVQSLRQLNLRRVS